MLSVVKGVKVVKGTKDACRVFNARVIKEVKKAEGVKDACFGVTQNDESYSL